MNFGISNLSIIPCRKEPSDKSEMVTQLLFGECFSVMETLGNWCRIKISYDEYECWIDKKQFQPIAPQTFEIINSAEKYYSNELLQIIKNNSTSLFFPVVIGSTLPDFDKGECVIENQSYSYDGGVINSSKPFNKQGIIEAALLYLDSPYLWGGKSPFGIDCSGFTQMVYMLNGIKILRDAAQQAGQGELLSFVEEAEAGDLAFFDNDEGQIVHVGIVMDNNKIIHASGKVRIDSFDHQGIFNQEKKNYSHRLRILKRIK